MSRERDGAMRGRAWRLAVEAAVAVALVLAVMLAPLGWLGPAARALQMPAAVVLLVCLAGKLLYDTLFYDHYAR